MRRIFRRSRTICLFLAFATLLLHLLLALLSIHDHQPCDPEPQLQLPKPPSLATVRPAESPPHKDADVVLTCHDRNVTDDGAVTAELLRSSLLKLEALFDHPLYNLPGQPVSEEDWLLRVKPKIKDSERSSQLWVSTSQEGYNDVQWNSSSSTHPPWLRFHLGISRWQLYSHRDANMEPLMQQLATHPVVSAVQKSGGTQLKLVMTFPNYGQALFKPMK
ncbi:extracellular serine/threonine protein kinase FAM20C-like [Synchiropus splendidus]|uniref:extracellular serine/threonine protein kinase FAM20C-like n=1 Tax=Synchiropus splendidus TaxID=270530 RepID=UPI00237DD67D|nr:extracellular serine/threonine protein kinase FAM20C-like [Synchiropus splendidus]